MNNRILAAFSFLSLLTSASAAFAQSEGRTFDIPFAFHVGGKVLPAGEYYVTPALSQGHVLAIRSLERKGSVAIIADGVISPKLRPKSSMEFNRYGSQYFLETVWTAGYDEGRRLRKSPAELEMANAAPAAQQTLIARTKR